MSGWGQKVPTEAISALADDDKKKKSLVLTRRLHGFNALENILIVERIHDGAAKGLHLTVHKRGEEAPSGSISLSAEMGQLEIRPCDFDKAGRVCIWNKTLKDENIKFNTWDFDAPKPVEIEIPGSYAGEICRVADWHSNQILVFTNNLQEGREKRAEPEIHFFDTKTQTRTETRGFGEDCVVVSVLQCDIMNRVCIMEMLGRENRNDLVVFRPDTMNILNAIEFIAQPGLSYRWMSNDGTALIFCTLDDYVG